MELLVDDSSVSQAVRLIALYSRANVKIVEMSSLTSQNMGLQLPVLSGQTVFKQPFAIITQLVQERAGILLGKTFTLQSQVSSYVEAALSVDNFLRFLDQELLTKTFLVSNHITAADIFAYQFAKSQLLALSLQERLKYVPVLRWAKHLQSLKGLDELLKPWIQIPDTSVSKVVVQQEKQPEEVKESQVVDEKKNEGQKQQKNPPKQQKNPPKQQKNPPKQQKNAPKQQKNPPKQQKAPAQQTPEVEDLAQLLDIRVGYIEEIGRHPSADKLYLEKVNFGTETRQVISGLVEHLQTDQLLNKLCLFLCNVKAGNIRGQRSEAMILCSHGNNGVQLLVPPENSKMGDRIYIDTLENFPVPVLPPKKKVWENVQPKLKIENGHAFYGDKIFKNENGLVLAPGVEAGTIS